ncbi:hypothetical protein ACFL1H_03955 [Nanoarchaeota archaeon]
MKIKIITILALILIFLPMVYADNHTINYENKDNYADENFLSTSDPEKWDVTLIKDWNNENIWQNPKIYNHPDIYSIPEIYESDNFYIFLDDEMYENLNYKIVNYDNIHLNYELLDYEKVDYDEINYNDVNYDKANHEKINPEKFMEQLGCEQCTLILETDEYDIHHLKYSKEKLFYVRKEATFKSYPPNTKFIVEYPDIQIILPNKFYELSVSESDNVVIRANYGIKLNNGSEIYGEFEIHNNILKIYQNSVDIDDIDIHPGDYQVEIVLGGDQSLCDDITNCVYYDKDNKIFNAHAQTTEITLEFLEYNPIFDFDEYDQLQISIKDGFLDIDNRDDIGLIPKVEYTSDFAGSINIINDHMSLDLAHDGLNLERFSTISDVTSVPFSLYVKDSIFEEKKTGPDTFIGEDGQIYYGDRRGDHADDYLRLGTYLEPKKLVFSNFNEFAFLDPDQKDGYLDIKEGFAPKGEINERLTFNNANSDYFINKYKDRLNLKNFNIYGELQSDETIAIKSVLESLYSLPYEVRKDIKGFNIFAVDTPFENANPLYGLIPDQAGGFASPLDNSILLREEGIYYPFIVHESAHIHHYSLIKDELKNDVINTLSKFPSLLNLLIDNKEEITFNKDWIDQFGVTNIDFKFTPAFFTDFHPIQDTWPDGSFGPKGEYITPYASTFYWEDIGEIVEMAAQDPNYFKPLIDPESPRYNAKIRQKLDKVFEGNFISKETYDEITDLSNSGCKFIDRCDHYYIKKPNGNNKVFFLDTYEQYTNGETDWDPNNREHFIENEE